MYSWPNGRRTLERWNIELWREWKSNASENCFLRCKRVVLGFWFGLWVMNIDARTISGSEPSSGKKCPVMPLSRLDAQRTQSAPCLCLVRLFKMVLDVHRACWLWALWVSLSRGWVSPPDTLVLPKVSILEYAGIFFSLEIIINYNC